ncbi:hypothetical protein AB0G04_01185 [Actinoplanes sp. NPDC023801]|uniref:hypothetical protein n=1 Tax=Actinoplanes sp. NPDC023801 TaxID=3154595 RepID=UPI0033C97527
MAGVWAAVLLAAVFWSARTDPPTVPEQRDIAQALATLRVASGAVVAAAEDERWALSIGELRVEDCSVNPAWAGQAATREVRLYVPEGDARAALETIAQELPADFAAEMLATRGATRLSLYADAGEHVGIEAEAHSSDQVLSVLIRTGCRPAVDGLNPADPPAGSEPALLGTTAAAITGSSTADPPETRAVACPDDGAAATFVLDAGPAQPESAPRGIPDGAAPIWADADGWAYRIGSDSVVVARDGDRFRLSVTTACRAT